MKAKLKGIRFSVWLMLCLFSLGIVLILGVLQFSLINPYYRNAKITTVKQVVAQLETYLIDADYTTSRNLESAFQLAVNNSMCAVIYNEAGTVIYSADSIGAGCLLNQRSTIHGENVFPGNAGVTLTNLLRESEGEYSETITNETTNQNMILYGKIIRSELGNYYLFVNSPLEPVDSILNFFREQYFFFTVIVLIAALIISLWVSKFFAKPVVQMKKSADHLAEADYDHTHFEQSYLSEMNDLADTLNDATTKLAKVDDLRKDLIANVSHDIKTPLSVIKAYAEMIQDISGDNKEKREQHLDVILKETDYLNHLVTDMQELSKMQSGTYEPTLENFDIAEKTQDIIELCQVLIDEKHLQVECVSEESVTVFADEVKIGQVIYNFLTNAIKHSKENGHIVCTIIRTEDAVKFSVKDEGSGIPAAELPYIWDRYYKIDKSFQRSSMGSTGLGLSIVKAILDSHHGKYGVESVEGEGSTFWFELHQENG